MQKSSNCVPKVGLVWTSQQFMKPNWKWHTSIGGEGSTKRNKIMKLNFCLHEFRGSATRAVNHLAGRGTGIRGCPQILESVRDMYWNYGKVSGFNSDLDEKPAAVNSVSQDQPVWVFVELGSCKRVAGIVLLYKRCFVYLLWQPSFSGVLQNTEYCVCSSFSPSHRNFVAGCC